MLHYKMSKCDVDRDGFQKVKSKSKRFTSKRPTVVPNRDTGFQKQEVSIDVDKVIRRIYCAVEDLNASNYLENVIKSVSNALQGRTVVEIVCLGLGHIAECNISKYQLGFLLCLKEHCNPKNILVHDPIFYESECKVLNRLGIKVISENSEGSYVISDKGVTVVYLPHCPKQLTNNFLWSNWGLNLDNCVLICNSFSSLVDNQPSRVLLETVPYIYKIFSYTLEQGLDNNFKFSDIFNDTAIHQFPKDKLEKLDSEFWMKGEKPTYENTEEFITSLMVKKLNI